MFARYGGLRCPSEVLSLRIQDVDLAGGRITVTSPKTEHYRGKGSRVIPLFPELEPFLREMLYHSLSVPPGGTPFDRDVVTRPEIAKYVEGWGRAGDRGLIAIHPDSNEAVGAVWVRLFQSGDKGYGYVDDRTPELGIAVLPEQRRLGVGSALLSRVLEIAGTVYGAVSLSVSMENPARRLYERFGFQPVNTCGNSITMLKHLKSRSGNGVTASGSGGSAANAAVELERQ
jgi:ribosomal protein S18 acetylase RimI-like enzyme